VKFTKVLLDNFQEKEEGAGSFSEGFILPPLREKAATTTARLEI
jgi:hypothetical protein